MSSTRMSSTRMIAMQRRRAIHTIVLGGLLLAAACTPQCSCEGPRPEVEKVTVFVVRHAEKEPVAADAPEAAKKDPPLSRAGQLRALGLADDLPVAELDAIYVTDFQRTRQTAAGVAAVTGLEPIVYPGQDAAGLATRLRKRTGEQVLVVGHSNTVPALLEALGVTEPIAVRDDQYGDLWIVRVQGAGVVELEVRRFGEQLPRAEGLR